ncbi:hypothetical protein FQN54_007187 [Arachnomyces sp. PD_36]|nr:hypothetical protein FQN54_007187 [Arachnomyces sp. PD_36]
MPPRRTHRKSRRGCLVCKQRRVKCDESGPPCGGCRARDIEHECRYASPPTQLQPPPRQDSFPSGGTTPTHCSYPPSSSGGRSPSPGRRQMEAQLMHRWSTVTYKTMSTPCADDENVWQNTVPDVAFKHEFLLHGIYAAAAFEISNSFPNEFARYGSSALEYQDRAISGFQAQLNVIGDDNHEAILYFSILLTTITLASAQYVAASGMLANKLQTTFELHALAVGIKVVMKNNKACFGNPLFRKVKPLPQMPKTPLNADTETALNRLTELNESRTHLVVNGHDQQQQYAAACKTALFWLRECFLTCLCRENRSYALPWISLSGEDYITAVKERDQLALIILMYWGVLLQPLGHAHWWATDFGIKLVDEISLLLPASDVCTMTTEAIAWPQNEVRICHDEDVIT